MRSIEIKGKHNRYQMKKVTRENEMYKYKSRVATREWDASLYEVETQMRILLEIKHCIRGAEACVENKKGPLLDKLLQTKEQDLMKRELETKLNGYRFQDQNKKREGRNISFTETIEKLVETRMLCYYCNTQCNVFYERVREMSQWSFDRIDNSLCHSVDNVVVACLKCNLHRKNVNSKKFKDTKDMKSIVLVPSQNWEDLLEFSPDGDTVEAEEKNTEKPEPFVAPTSTIYRPKAGRRSVEKLTDDVLVDDGVIVTI